MSEDWRTATISEIRRTAACLGLSRRVAEEAEAIAKRHPAEGFGADAVAVAVLWLATRRLGEPRPLRELLRCSMARGKDARRAIRKLLRAVGPAAPPIETYVKVVVSRAGLPTFLAAKALEILRTNRRALTGYNPWVRTAAALYLAAGGRQNLLKILAETANVSEASVKLLTKKLTCTPS